MKPLVLVPDSISTDTVQCLQQLLKHARQGDIVGLGFVAMLKGRQFIANTAGAAHIDPTLTRGMLRGLDDKLSRYISGEPPEP